MFVMNLSELSPASPEKKQTAAPNSSFVPDIVTELSFHSKYSKNGGTGSASASAGIPLNLLTEPSGRVGLDRDQPGPNGEHRAPEPTRSITHPGSEQIKSAGQDV